jgi:hypothetical protein
VRGIIAAEHHVGNAAKQKRIVYCLQTQSERITNAYDRPTLLMLICLSFYGQPCFILNNERRPVQASPLGYAAATTSDYTFVPPVSAAFPSLEILAAAGSAAEGVGTSGGGEVSIEPSHLSQLAGTPNPTPKTKSLSRTPEHPATLPFTWTFDRHPNKCFWPLCAPKKQG